MHARAKLERLYICTELYNRICFVWVKFMVLFTIFSVSLAVIWGTFVSIRYTMLPLYVYIVFPNTAVTFMLIIFWASYDVVVLTRDSEDILGKLLSHQVSYLRTAPKDVRTRVMKRARAMRVIEFPIGDFADFTINLPIAIWDEILNQVLFLLSF